MAFAAPERPVAPRPPKPPRPLQPMALTHQGRKPEGRRSLGIYTGPAPEPDYIWEHCLREARRELDCLSNGQLYQWKPFVPHWSDSLEPLDFFEFVK